MQKGLDMMRNNTELSMIMKIIKCIIENRQKQCLLWSCAFFFLTLHSDVLQQKDCPTRL